MKFLKIASRVAFLSQPLSERYDYGSFSLTEPEETVKESEELKDKSGSPNSKKT